MEHNWTRWKSRVQYGNINDHAPRVSHDFFLICEGKMPREAVFLIKKIFTCLNWRSSSHIDRDRHAMCHHIYIILLYQNSGEHFLDHLDLKGSSIRTPYPINCGYYYDISKNWSGNRTIILFICFSFIGST